MEKKLSNNEIAIAFYNLSNSKQKINLNWKTIKSLNLGDNTKATNLWEDENLNLNKTQTLTIPKHGIKLYKLVK